MSFALKFRPLTKSNVASTLLPKNGNIVEATGNKVACCFDIVASVDWALHVTCGGRGSVLQ